MTGLRLDAVVLAAGAGVRFGGRKLTTPFGEGVLLDGALRAAFAAPVRSVRVVTGADDHVPDAALSFAEARGEAERLRIVRAQDHALGLSASLKAAITDLPADCEGVFVFLGDMPRIPTAIFEPMVEAVDHGAAAVAPVFHGKRGHPVLFGPGLFAEIMELQGDKGATGLLDALGEALVTIPSPDDGVLFDVDVRPEGRTP